jgi:L-ascorbate metabolism protein UlaG (beta-lactamase superfamily)
MEITYIGHSSFKIKTKQSTLITDPYTVDSHEGSYPKKQSADIITVSHTHEDHNNIEAIDGSPYVITGPGEYEIKGTGIIGYGFYHDTEKGNTRGKNTVFRIDAEGISLVHLGDLGHVFTEDEADHLGSVDVLFIPVGGFYTIGPKEAQAIIKEISPSIIIPMHYKRPGFDAKAFAQLLPVTDFFSSMGLTAPTPVDKLTLQKELIPEEQQIVLFQ